MIFSSPSVTRLACSRMRAWKTVRGWGNSLSECLEQAMSWLSVAFFTPSIVQLTQDIPAPGCFVFKEQTDLGEGTFNTPMQRPMALGFWDSWSRTEHPNFVNSLELGKICGIFHEKGIIWHAANFEAWVAHRVTQTLLTYNPWSTTYLPEKNIEIPLW